MPPFRVLSLRLSTLSLSLYLPLLLLLLSLHSECYPYAQPLYACTSWRVCRNGPCIYAMCLRVRVHACAGVGQRVCARTCACVCVRTKVEVDRHRDMT